MRDNSPAMVDEQQLIPFSAEVLRGERLLVFAPHPDDEVIGPGGLIAQHARERRIVRVVVCTDGTAAEVSTNRDAYAAKREEETTRALKSLGVDDVRFLRFRDRSLASEPALSESLAREIDEFKPDLIALPAPAEVHPDHAALADAFIALLHRDSEMTAVPATCRVAFYEVSQPIRPNTLVAIDDVADAKLAAIREHASQLALRDYESFARGLNAYRAMTLSPAVKYAEAYFVCSARDIRTRPASRLVEEMSPSTARLERASETIPISVVIRTKDRPVWLREAVESVVETGYPAEIVIVNDGGKSPEETLPPELAAKTRIVSHTTSQGRSAAMNDAVKNATGTHIAFLDDDDLYYREHLDVLARAATESSYAAYYTDAVSAFLVPSEDGSYRVRDRIRIFASDFDRDLLLFDNYIPLPTLLVRKSDFESVGGFDPALDLFEDWDFLLRLSERGAFLRIPRVTCEVRHFEGSQSSMTTSVEGTDAFRRAKIEIWKRHATKRNDAALANVLARQKQRAQQLFSEAVELRGRASHLEGDVSRLEREKQLLIAELSTEHSARTQADMAVAQLTNEVSVLRDRVGALEKFVAELEGHLGERDETIRALYGEVARLNALLDAIYGSRTWKLHRFVERMTGRGA